MRYELVLFDADDTLFDFGLCESVAFARVMEAHGVVDQPRDFYPSYQRISRDLWALLEKGRTTKDELKVERFRELFKRYKLEKDARSASEAYIEALAEQSFLLEGALETLRDLKGQCRIGIVTNGISHVQKRRLELSPLHSFIELMVVSEECGFPKPDERIFAHTLEKFGHKNKTTTLMVGDRLEADIQGAWNHGIASCWFNPQRAHNRSGVIPTHVIHKLPELTAVVRGKI